MSNEPKDFPTFVDGGNELRWVDQIKIQNLSPPNFSWDEETKSYVRVPLPFVSLQEAMQKAYDHAVWDALHPPVDTRSRWEKIKNRLGDVLINWGAALGGDRDGY